MRVSSLYRYPVKGLSAEPIDWVELTQGDFFPYDRLYALENGPSGFHPDAPEHQPKIKFLMLMKNASLAGLKTQYEERESILSILHQGKIMVKESLASAPGRREIENFLTHYLGQEIRGPVRILKAPEGFRFTDSKSGFVSLVNLASVRAIEAAASAHIDPLRFRANIYIDSAAPWDETAWPGSRLIIGAAMLEVLKMTDRCAATGVEPASGIRDMDLVQTIRGAFGHIDCGVYARVISTGRIARGDTLSVL